MSLDRSKSPIGHHHPKSTILSNRLFVILAFALIAIGGYSLITRRYFPDDSDAGELPAVWIATTDAEAPDSPRLPLLPDIGGAIELVACTVNSARNSGLRNAHAVNQIVNTLPPEVRILILTNDRAAFSVLSNPDPQRIEFVDLPGESSFTIWPQDPFVVLAGSNRAPDDPAHPGEDIRFLLPERFGRADDAKIAVTRHAVQNSPRLVHRTSGSSVVRIDTSADPDSQSL
jgi:hypothetical protein